MRKLLLIALLFVSTKSFSQTPTQVVKADGYAIPLYNFSNIEPDLNRANDTLYVYNFWATLWHSWVEELPVFFN